MNRYAIRTEINCITNEEYWPCGTESVSRIDKRLSITNAIIAASHNLPDKVVRVVIVEGEFNRLPPLKVKGSSPYRSAKELEALIN